MFKREYKLILSVVLVFTLFFSFSGTFAFAEQTNIVIDFATTIWYALRAAQVTVNSTVAPIQDILDTLNFGSGAPWSADYTYSGPTWDNDILNLSSIVVRPDFVEIDGVMYTDIWLSNDAAQKFRVNAFDVESAWNLVSNSNGVYAQGAGWINTIPVFYYNNAYRTQRFSVIASGDSVASVGSSPYALYLFTRFNDNVTNKYQFGARFGSDIPVFSVTDPSPFMGSASLANSNLVSTNWDLHFYKNGVWQSGSSTRVSTVGPVLVSPFDFEWVSGNVPLEQLPADYGLNIRLPTSQTDPDSGETIYDLGDLVREYPEQSGGKPLNFDPSLNPEVELDVDYTNELWRILEMLILLGLLDDAEIKYAPYDDPSPEPSPSPDPSPPPSPEPSTPISDQPAEWLDQILRWIQETISTVKNAVQTLDDKLTQIYDKVEALPQQILQDIETAPIDIYRRCLDIIKVVFAPIILLLRSVIGLWHYVVEWVQVTAPVFSSFFGFMSGTSYNMVLPIYASLAGPIVIAVYKRFGK